MSVVVSEVSSAVAVHQSAHEEDGSPCRDGG
jgi:hypothetical protein